MLMAMNKRKWGWILLLAPIPGLVLTLALYAVTRFVIFSNVGTASEQGLLIISQLVTVVLGVMGIVFVVGIIIGMPAGLILLLTAPKPQIPVPTTGQKY